MLGIMVSITVYLLHLTYFLLSLRRWKKGRKRRERERDRDRQREREREREMQWFYLILANRLQSNAAVIPEASPVLQQLLSLPTTVKSSSYFYKTFPGLS
jgi:hypothetical protein